VLGMPTYCSTGHLLDFSQPKFNQGPDVCQVPRYAQFSTLLSHGLDLPLVARCVIEHYDIAGAMLNCSRAVHPFGLLRKSQRADPTEYPSHAALSLEPDP
jgi:hypothetical protein